MKLLLEKGADIKAKDEVVILGLFIFFFFLGIVLSISYFTFSKDEWTPLHYASQYGEEEIVKLFLEKGANIEAKDKVVIYYLSLLFSISPSDLTF